MLPHQSLRQERQYLKPTLGTGSHQRWQPKTPAMVAGLTSHIWTTSQLLSYRVPVSFIEKLPQLEYLFSDPDKLPLGR